MRRIIVTGPEPLVAQLGPFNWIECLGNSDVFDVLPEEFDLAIANGKRLGLTIEERIAEKIYVRTGPSVHCFCGQRLHYPSEEGRKFVTRCCATLGEYVRMACSAGEFLVPRHYLALHGLKGAELSKMGFEKWVTKATDSIGLSKQSPLT